MGRGWVLSSQRHQETSPKEADCSVQALVLKDSMLIENLRPTNQEAIAIERLLPTDSKRQEHGMACHGGPVGSYQGWSGDRGRERNCGLGTLSWSLQEGMAEAG